MTHYSDSYLGTKDPSAYLPLHQAIQHAPTAIAILDNDLNYIAVSDRYIQLHNQVGKPIVGYSLYEVFPDCPQRWKDAHQRVLNGAIEKIERDTFVEAHGTTRDIMWECRPWYTADDEIGGIILYVKDIA